MNLRSQLAVTITVWLGIILSMFAGVFISGNFRVNNTNHNKWFGVYDRYVPHEAYYNTAFETVAVFEMFSLFVLPLFLLAVRRLMGLGKKFMVMPWLIMSAAVLFAAFIWPFGMGARARPLDPLVTSELPELLRLQLPLFNALAVVVLLLRKRSGAAKGTEAKVDN